MKLSKGKISLAIIAFALGVIVSTEALAGKQACLSLKKQYQNLQKQLRSQGRGATRNNKLSKEHALFNQWQRCEQGKLNPKKKKIKKSTSAKRKTANSALAYKSKIKRGNKQSQSYQAAMTKSIALTSRFKGAQQQQWLDYYQRPARCIKPKSTQEFAYCIEHEREQQVKYLQSYVKN